MAFSKKRGGAMRPGKTASAGFVRNMIWLLLVSFAGHLSANAEALQSPWAAVSIDPSAPAYLCGPAPQLPVALSFNGYYVDKHHSIVDPKAKAAYEAVSRANELFVKEVGKAADGYQVNHSESALECAISLLDGAAKEKVFTRAELGVNGTRDGFYVQGFYLDGLAFAYLKVRDSTSITREQRAEIEPWLLQMASSVRDFYDAMKRQHAGDGHNNLTYWGALAVAATGIATDHHDFFDWGMKEYGQAVGQIRSDGTLPLEMDRAAMALHYHLFATAPLVLLAELGEVNGLGLYSKDNGALHRLVQRTIDGLADPSYFEKTTGVAQEMPKELDGSVIGWAVPYEARFPSPILASLLAKAESTSDWQFGGLPPA
jgi:poly(beta-D-mannuronate) lyase